MTCVLALCGLSCGITMRMPDQSYEGQRPELTGEQIAAAERLRKSVNHLAVTIGERNTRQPQALAASADYIEQRWQALGLEPKRLGYAIGNESYDNLEVIIPGSTKATELVVIGAHYDSAVGTPGANDNGSGVAMLLELSRRLATYKPARSLHLVAFVNEEPPYFRTNKMGSRVYADQLANKEKNVVAMLSLETIGYYTDADDSQHYPFPFSLFYPSRGNFVAFVANSESVNLARDSVAHFRQSVDFPSEGAAAPSSIEGIDWSDQQGFWLNGYPALMVTDTAPNRYPHYHEPSDTPAQLDFEAMALVTDGVEAVVKHLLDR